MPIGIQAKKNEILTTVEYCEVDLIMTNKQYYDFLCEVFQEYSYKVYVYNIENNSMKTINAQGKFVPKTSELLNNGDENDVALMLHTSGTTSNPKRVMLTHKNLIYNIEANIESLKLEDKDNVLIALPMFFGYCNTAQFLTHIYLGARMTILDGMFLPKKFFQIVEQEKITNFTGVPSMLLMLLEYKYSENYDYSSLKFICFGGGKMPKNKLEMLIERYQTIRFVHTYGQTECSPRVTALLPEFSLSKIGSVGKTISGVEIKIVNDKGEVKNEEIGEILVKGPNVMKGYFKHQKATNEAIIDNWIHTGDLGYIDSDGFLYLTGRIKNVIISGGINIYPEEIEEFLLKQEGVKEVCVHGESDELLGEIPVAKIVTNGELCESVIKDICREKLASYKVPRKIIIVEKLEKTYNGKIKR